MYYYVYRCGICIELNTSSEVPPRTDQEIIPDFIRSRGAKVVAS